MQPPGIYNVSLSLCTISAFVVPLVRYPCHPFIVIRFDHLKLSTRPFWFFVSLSAPHDDHHDHHDLDLHLRRLGATQAHVPCSTSTTHLALRDLESRFHQRDLHVSSWLPGCCNFPLNITDHDTLWILLEPRTYTSTASPPRSYHRADKPQRPFILDKSTVERVLRLDQRRVRCSESGWNGLEVAAG